MARIVDKTLRQPNKHKIYEVVVKNIKYYTDGSSKATYTHTIKYPGWEEFFADEEA